MSTNKFLKGMASHFVRISGKQIHYLNEGKGPIILFVHGIPEWCACYTDVVVELRKRYRCIVPDLTGFGLSEKDSSADLGPEAHSARLLAFIRGLKLERIHLVVHDYGGPIGLGALLQQPELFASVTISNTWLWSLQGSAAEKPLKAMQGALGRWLYLRYGFSVKFMAKNGFADKQLFREKARDMLISVHRTHEERYANYQLMLEMLRSSAYFDSCFGKLQQLSLQGQFIWGMKDRFFLPDVYLSRWMSAFPSFEVHRANGSGHFPHMEAAGFFAERISDFIAAKNG
jgi:pimeloyl-ACP methyl ester carboxylesterase